MIFRHFALLSFIFAGLGVGVILRTFGHNRSLSISSHAAKQRVSYWLFLVSLCLATLCFYLFTFFWLVPEVGASGISVVFIILALGLLVMAAVIPDSGGRKSLWHGIAAWSMAFFLVCITISLLPLAKLSTGAYAVVLLATLYMITDWFIFLFIKQSRKHFLIFQASYIVAFYGAMFAVAYL